MREDTRKGVYVENLTEIEVQSVQDVIQLLLIVCSSPYLSNISFVGNLITRRFPRVIVSYYCSLAFIGLVQQESGSYKYEQRVKPIAQCVHMYYSKQVGE